jgi:hypothetical protein
MRTEAKGLGAIPVAFAQFRLLWLVATAEDGWADNHPSSSLTIHSAIKSVADFDEQTLVAHSSQVATGNADCRQLRRPHCASVPSEGRRPLSQRRLRATSEA